MGVHICLWRSVFDVSGIGCVGGAEFVILLKRNVKSDLGVKVMRAVFICEVVKLAGMLVLVVW